MTTIDQELVKYENDLISLEAISNRLEDTLSPASKEFLSIALESHGINVVSMEEDKKDGMIMRVLKAIWRAISGFFKLLWRMISAPFRWIKKLFSKNKSGDTVLELVKETKLVLKASDDTLAKGISSDVLKTFKINGDKSSLHGNEQYDRLITDNAVALDKIVKSDFFNKAKKILETGHALIKSKEETIKAIKSITDTNGGKVDVYVGGRYLDFKLDEASLRLDANVKEEDWAQYGRNTYQHIKLWVSAKSKENVSEESYDKIYGEKGEITKVAHLFEKLYPDNWETKALTQPDVDKDALKLFSSFVRGYTRYLRVICLPLNTVTDYAKNIIANTSGGEAVKSTTLRDHDYDDKKEFKLPSTR